MKKWIVMGMICISMSAHAKITVNNQSIPLSKLPQEIRTFVETDYIDTCQGIAEDEEFSIQNPNIRFDRDAFQHVDLNGDGLKDYVIQSASVRCKGALTMFTGNSFGFLDIYFQGKDGHYQHVLNYWLGKEGLTLQKYQDRYRYYSKYSQSYLMWDTQKAKFISYYAPEKRFDILDEQGEAISTEQKAIFDAVLQR